MKPEVLATGPGLLAKHIAPAAKKIIATDYSEGMIREAEKGYNPPNPTFETADAIALPFMANCPDNRQFAFIFQKNGEIDTINMTYSCRI